ncbi:DNA polymerase III subunit chi [Ramlibacter rhizophilus]|uniref:DNA polymerase III subunit chi n=1 Tax=Ramlibacter rhizophilus TaxID=1781167 RepID=A0A4Z0BZ15_9BURK|nr:DNA polymerase III subunit chi [Ramlibacter rhizophilus]TFZ03189.1 DNA polymerase III subunit chi [Ramlibacter rhizophilus]
MTQVAFHFNAPGRLAYACRLLRKATAGGATVVVAAGDETLDELDTALWTFSATDFLPHCRLPGASEAVLRHSPIVLSGAPLMAPHRDVLVNLGDEVPEGFEQFERVIEVVALDEDERQRARRRWKRYADQGLAIQRHDLGQAAS